MTGAEETFDVGGSEIVCVFEVVVKRLVPVVDKCVV